MDCNSRYRGEKRSSTAALCVCADTPHQIHIMLAKIVLLQTVVLSCICCMITRTAFKQDWDPTVTGNLEIAIGNLCLPASQQIMLRDKTAWKDGQGGHPPILKIENEVKQAGVW